MFEPRRTTRPGAPPASSGAQVTDIFADWARRQDHAAPGGALGAGPRSDRHATGDGATAPGLAGGGRFGRALAPSARRPVATGLLLVAVGVAWLLSGGPGDDRRSSTRRAQPAEGAAAGEARACGDTATAARRDPARPPTAPRAPLPRPDRRSPRQSSGSARPAPRSSPPLPRSERPSRSKRFGPSRPAPPAWRAPALPAPVPPGSPPEFF